MGACWAFDGEGLNPSPPPLPGYVPGSTRILKLRINSKVDHFHVFENSQYIHAVTSEL